MVRSNPVSDLEIPVMRDFSSFRSILLAVMLLTAWTAASPRPAIGDEGPSPENDMIMTCVPLPPAMPGNRHYVANRAPLAPSPLAKLPIGSIEPKGWLAHQLRLEAEGQVGRLAELSRWLKSEGNAWLSPEGKGHSPWEELPYWLKGFGDLGYVLKEERVIAEARTWIEGILSSQDASGWFGPRDNLARIDGHPDIWPNMVALNALQSFHEATGDARVLPFMARYFAWERAFPEEHLLLPYWQKLRGGDNLESILWLYNRTGDAELLETAEKVHRRTSPWIREVADWHGVNIAQGFREPATYYLLSRDPRHLEAAERNYREVLSRYGRVPGGMFGADENAREGFDGPRQGAETCTMVEFMHSFEMLLKISGDPVWADRCEEVAFNDFPASRTEDLKALHYLTAPNMPLLDHENKSPGIQNGGCMLAFSPHRYRCCQHNVSHGWPYYAEELWHATGDDGLCASLYAACRVRGVAGDDIPVELEVDTDYPFGEAVRITVRPGREARFPLYLRIPAWTEKPVVVVNGEAADAPVPGAYARIERTWKDGDRVDLTLPMTLEVIRYPGNRGALSVRRGPLHYALRIEERWVREGGTDAWPEWDVFPDSPWNYGLDLDPENPESSIAIVRREGPLPDQPFARDGAALNLRAPARRIPEWTLDHLDLVHELQEGPVRTEAPLETVTLIPMGCARLRIAAFPEVGHGEEAKVWTRPPVPPPASHCFSGDTTLALFDGRMPAHSDDHSIPRFTWWDHKGTVEWVGRPFETPTTVSACAVYWFDDRPRNGGCRVPASWRVLYRDGETFKPVTPKGSYGVERDRMNRIEFEPVETTELRIEATLKTGWSGGILEWIVK